MGGLRFIERGRGGKVLICLHGFLGEAGDWFAFADEFLSLNSSWRVVMLNLPGHGIEESGWKCPDAEHFSRALRDLVLEMGWGSAVIAGYSLGGRLGLHAALSFPSCFPVFIGLSTTAGIDDPVEREARIVADAALADRLASGVDFSAFLREWWNQPVFASPVHNEEGFEKFFANRLLRDPLRMAACLETWSAGRLPSQWPLLCEYSGSALLLSGEADEKYCSIAERMASAFAHGQSSRVPDAGHQLLVEKPIEVAREVSRFLLSNF